jgi:oligopeptide/dipeptide ABC transporter ATP-binding protein
MSSAGIAGDRKTLEAPTEFPVVEAVQLTKRFHVGPRFRRKGFNAVDRVSFQIREGESVGIVGESGCGKSTLARMVLQLETPTSGELKFAGTPYDRLVRTGKKEFRRSIQAVFQDPYTSLDPSQRVEDIVGETVRAYGRSERRARAREALAAVALPEDEILRRYPHQFSGGQRQRIALARALAPRPRLVVLDEPTSALDVSMRAQVLNLLIDVHEKFETSFLLISHDILSVRHITDRCLVMYLGALMETGPSDLVIKEPLHPYTQALVAAMTETAMISGEPATGGADEVPNPVDRPPGCPFNTRCPHAWDKCRTEEPPALAVEKDRRVACWLFEGDFHRNEPVLIEEGSSENQSHEGVQQ